MDFAIIAAGEGSRLAREGIATPKPLVCLHGEPLIKRLVDVFLSNKASSISIIVNEEMKEVQEYLRGMQVPVPFNIIVKSTPSSMHSFYELSRCLAAGSFCLTTVDTIFREEEFGRYVKAFQEAEGIDGLMAVTDYVDDEKPLWVNVLQNLAICGFSDAAERNSRYVSGGIYCLKSKAIEVLNRAMESGVSRMRNYQRRLVDEGLRLKAYPFSKIVDIDHAGDIAKAEQFLST